ncbi:hypothetical protein [Undibacterium pigrum]|uniref:Uncharacterized protein n=1 Tax=Undibacterium pigrum TaxID=401470 RepID=A0A318IKZ5_9BURK|nr:hypothetical protein [Undibacterium pigrum]PXX34926.1 hypothetical protein DFR42_1245 [Undibacterium pigrum]
MMARYFSKIGVWLFIATVTWYLSGNFLIDHLKKEKVTYYKNKHVAKQQADIGNSGRVLISVPDGYKAHFALIFDPAISQVSINNENLQVATSMQSGDGVLNVILRKAEIPVIDHDYSSKTEIRLPSTVGKVEIAGGSSVEISGRLPAPAAELVLEISDCRVRTSFKEFVVGRLKLVSICKVPSKEKCCAASFYLAEHISVEKLEVILPYGHLDFSAELLPQQILLNVGNDVTVSARRAFLEKARFTAVAK